MPTSPRSKYKVELLYHIFIPCSWIAGEDGTLSLNAPFQEMLQSKEPTVYLTLRGELNGA